MSPRPGGRVGGCLVQDFVRRMREARVEWAAVRIWLVGRG